MTFPALLGLVAWAAVAAFLGAIGAVALARFAGAPAPVQPLARLRGWDLPLAGVVLLFGQVAGLSLLEGRDPLLPPPLSQLLVGLVSGLLAWLFLGLREGSFAPRRQPVRGRRLREIGNVVSCYLIALPGFLALSGFNNRLVALLAGAPPVSGPAAGWEKLTAGPLAAVLVLAVLVLPLLEEALFRGYLWRFLAGRPDFGPRRALLYSALLFALAHQPEVWLPMLYLGGLFGWVYWRSGRLRYAVLAHALHNALAALTLLLPDTVTDVLL